MYFILIAEVGTEWNFCRSFIIPYEVILQVKLSYFGLLKDNKILTINFDAFTKMTEVFRMVPIWNLSLRYAKWMSFSYKISWGIQKLTLFLFPNIAEVKAE